MILSGVTEHYIFIQGGINTSWTVMGDNGFGCMDGRSSGRLVSYLFFTGIGKSALCKLLD